MNRQQPEQTSSDSTSKHLPAETKVFEERGFLFRATTAGALALSFFSFESSRADIFTPGMDNTPAAASETITDLSEYRINVPVKTDREEQVQASQPERISVTAEGERWMQMQREIASASTGGEGDLRLIDGTTFITVECEEALRGFSGMRDRGRGLHFAAISENDYKFAITTAAGDVWYVSEAPHYKDQFPEGIPFREKSLEIWKKGSEKLIQKEFSTAGIFLLNADGTARGINFERLEKQMTAAEINYRSETEDAGRVRHYKLTRDPVGYIALVDGNQHDPIMAGLINDCKYLPQLLNKLQDEHGNSLYNLVSENGSEFVAVERSPKELLRSHIKGMYDDGIRSFYLNLAGHGNQHGIYFQSETGYRVLTPAALHSVFSEFKDCDFIVDTVACYGGGMADEMKEYEDPSGKSGRIFMKLQAKPYSYNQEGRIEGEEGINGAPKVHSSYYQIFNAYFLMQGLSFGEAHYQADLAAKKLIPCDAEGWLSSSEGGRQTASQDETNPSISAN